MSNEDPFLPILAGSPLQLYTDEFATLAPGWDPGWGYIPLKTFTTSPSAPSGYTALPVVGSFYNADNTLATRGRLLFIPSISSQTSGSTTVMVKPFLVDLVNGSIPTNTYVLAPTSQLASGWTWNVTGRVDEVLIEATLAVPTTNTSWVINPIIPSTTLSPYGYVDNGDGTISIG